MPPANTMFKRCTVCQHPNRKEIDKRILDGGVLNKPKLLMKEYGITPAQFLRHKEQHMIVAAKELVNMCNEEYDKMLQETGTAKKLLSINVLDAFIEKYKDVLHEVTAKDVLAAIKLKEDLLGTVVEKKEVTLTWLNEIPKEEPKDEQDKV